MCVGTGCVSVGWTLKATRLSMNAIFAKEHDMIQISRKAELCSAFCKHQRKHYVDIQHITDNAPDEQTDPSSQPRTEVPCADIYMYHAIFVAAQLK